MTTDRIIDQAIDFILQHRREAIHVEDAARHCHFSKYHYSYGEASASWTRAKSRISALYTVVWHLSP